MNKQDCFRKALHKSNSDPLVAWDPQFIPGNESSITDLLFPTFEKQLHARDIQNFISRTASIDPLMLKD